MLTRFRIEIFSVAIFYLVQVLVLGVEGKGVVQERTEEIAARRQGSSTMDAGTAGCPGPGTGRCPG